MYRIEDCPQIQNNIFLKSRNIGASRKLKGDIEIIICFMKKRAEDFTKSTQAQFTRELFKACDWLKKSAEKYGTQLSFKYRFFTIDTPANAIPDQEGYELIKEFFSNEDLSMDELQKRYEKASGSNEAPFILVFDEISRSFAHIKLNRYGNSDEISVVFKNYGKKFLWSDIAHELLHQFGAHDYYYPLEVTECAEKYFKDSIMGIGSEDVLDDLTAYIVGIKDTISADSYRFLEETMWITYDLRCQQIDNEWNGREDRRKITESRSSTKASADNESTKKSTDEKKQKRSAEQPTFTPIYAKQPGIVVTTNVLAGSVVKKGDIIAVTGNGEQTAIPAEVPGRIQRIYIKPGERIKAGTLVATIERI